MPATRSQISYRLPSLMTAETAELLTEKMREWSFNEAPSITLDASAVESISTSGAQILLALEKTVSTADGKLEITEHKDVVGQVLQELGLGWLVSGLR